MKIAIIGSGIAGLSAAYALYRDHEITLFEQDDRLGGHSHTVDMPDGFGGQVAVDTGFIVYNTHNYPNLVHLFDATGVATEASDMSFAVSIGKGNTEYFGDMPGMFAQRRNLLRPSHWLMIRDIMRFYKEAPSYLEKAREADLSIGELLAGLGYSSAFRYRHLLPMAGAIWSTPVEQVNEFPAESFINFFQNHRLLEMDLQARPVWRTVSGGSRSYVDRITRLFADHIAMGCPVRSAQRTEDGIDISFGAEILEQATFDEVIFACHPDQALAILGSGASTAERDVLGSIAYEKNRAILHTDINQMPRRKRAWASWNYIASREAHEDGPSPVALTYWMNKLQNLNTAEPALLTLNPLEEPDPAKVIGEWSYDHPQFTRAALRGQRTLGEIQGAGGVWFCGAWCGHGFHEDGAAAGFAVAKALGSPVPWSDRITEMSPSAENAAPLAPPLRGVYAAE
ncbi:NAD(P)/FAD-dependent oxidoreductase [Aquisalinus flavus]|uniref:NAD/FAD-binding protein n=1 Tax=Aquisalinus flavus TaxID=1526572 RepID=A0A8J2V6B2_9PROT|nr:FAD-dependent oxidoreductase [Aquisalinus flavus]MBD0426077.1 FAD-dependent oxidoreductase [Aquisalinus flavus]UNE48338.1 FAD-dependent oxidoreductase [Aquisalinus flavus]GGD10851.1 NAD/FAD-binding protein [Aquisalinus flavus]